MVAKTRDLTLIPVMLCFFAMGFVDLVGIASNYVKEDLQLTDSDGYADEQTRTEEHGDALPHRDHSVFADSTLR